MSETRPRRGAYRLGNGKWRVPCGSPDCPHYALVPRRVGGKPPLCTKCHQRAASKRERAKSEARREAAGKRPLRNPADDLSVRTRAGVARATAETDTLAHDAAFAAAKRHCKAEEAIEARASALAMMLGQPFCGEGQKMSTTGTRRVRCERS